MSKPVQILTVAHPAGDLLVSPSRSEAGKTHILTVASDGRFECSCPGFLYRRNCAHVKAAGELAHAQHAEGE